MTRNGTTDRPATRAPARPGLSTGSVPVNPRRPRAVPRWERRYVRGLLALDLVVGLTAGWVALLVRFGEEAGPVYTLLTLLLPFLWVSVLWTGRAYEGRFLTQGSEEYRRVFDSGVRLFAVAAVTALALRYELARGYVLLALPVCLVGSLVGRRLARAHVARARRRGGMVHRAVATGTERAVAELIRRLRREPGCAIEVIAACVDRSSSSHIEGVPVVGPADGVVAALASLAADTVAVGAWSSFSQGDLRRLGWDLEGTGVDLLVAPSLTDVAGPRISFRPVAGLPLLHVEQPQFRGVRRVAKSLFDRGVALVLLLVAAVPLLLVGVVIRADSAGPALFHQTRVGLRGRTFTMLKFRSMRVTAEQELATLAQQNEKADGLLFKMRADPRITRVGRVLRRFSLDELPQLLNVLLGQMSLVGPRPPLPREVELYRDDVRRRLLVKPGLTGLWQVGGRSDLSWDESVRLDLYYVENWSPALDAQILWRTAAAILSRRGAY